MFYFFDQLPSTVDESRDPKYVGGDVVVAEYQTAGRGQRGNKWSSAAGENLTFSVVLDTSFLRVTEQFGLLQVVALALADTFASWGLDARIKWTNDIYIGDRKITGVLIDHTPGTGGMLARSGVGVGINVNQIRFEEWLPNPTSMAVELGRKIDRREILERFYERLMDRVGELKAAVSGTSPESGGYGAADGYMSGREKLQSEYHSLIYRLGVEARFALPDGSEFTGVIRGVGPGGELAIDDGSEVRSFLFREVSFII